MGLILVTHLSRSLRQALSITLFRIELLCIPLSVAMAMLNWVVTVLVLVLHCCSHSCLAARAFVRSHQLNGASSYVTQEPLWFSQRLDHFQSQDRRVFPQRFYQSLDFFHRPTNAPIFLRICGEGTCSGIPNDYLAVCSPHSLPLIGSQCCFNSCSNHPLLFRAAEKPLLTDHLMD